MKAQDVAITLACAECEVVMARSRSDEVGRHTHRRSLRRADPPRDWSSPQIVGAARPHAAPANRGDL